MSAFCKISFRREILTCRVKRSDRRNGRERKGVSIVFQLSLCTVRCATLQYCFLIANFGKETTGIGRICRICMCLNYTVHTHTEKYLRNFYVRKSIMSSSGAHEIYSKYTLNPGKFNVRSGLLKKNNSSTRLLHRAESTFSSARPCIMFFYKENKFSFRVFNNELSSNL